MALLGLLLALAAVVLTVGVLATNATRVAVHAFGLTQSGVSLRELFIAGAVTALVFALGLAMMARGLARSRRRRLERRRLVRDSQQQSASLTAEKARLERELEQERARRATAPVSRERTVVERQPIVERERVVDREPVVDGTTGPGADGGNDPGRGRSRLFRR